MTLSITRSRVVATGLVLGFGGLVLGGAPGVSSHPAPAWPGAMEVMLTNDDGYDAPGLVAIRDVLCNAGHRVTVVAPAENQSGTGTTMAGGELVVRVSRSTFVCDGRDADAWAVESSPAKSVVFGIREVFADRPPDLIISGSNAGQNITRSGTLHSGTVGAAVTAIEYGVPAMAVNTGFDLADAGTLFEQTTAAYPDTARYVVQLVRQLRATQPRDEQLLPPHTALNVTYPVALDADGNHDPELVKEPKITSLGLQHFYSVDFVDTAEGSGIYRTVTKLCGDPDEVPPPSTPTAIAAAQLITVVPCGPEPVADADSTAIAEDHISITPLDDDWTVSSAAVRADIRERLGVR